MVMTTSSSNICGIASTVPQMATARADCGSIGKAVVTAIANKKKRRNNQPTMMAWTTATSSCSGSGSGAKLWNSNQQKW